MNNTTEFYSLIKNKYLLYLFIIYVIFILNDFIFIEFNSYPEWVIVDFLLRLIYIFIILAVSRFRELSGGALKSGIPIWKIIGIAIIMAVACLAIDIFTYKFKDIIPSWDLFIPPKPTSSILHVFDLTVGLTLVAFSEELVFRVLYPQVVSRYINSRAFILFSSSLIFALIHWSSGFGSVLVAFLTGTILMLSVFRTGTILPAILAHYLINLVKFW